MKLLTTATSVLLGVSILSLSSSLYASDLATSNISKKQIAANQPPKQESHSSNKQSTKPKPNKVHTNG